jgi:hypothetical protein
VSSGQYGNVEVNLRGVEESARLLKRLYLSERETMRALGAWHFSVADAGLKAMFPRDWWQDSLHADALRNRVLELRYPKRDVDNDHNPELVGFLGEITRAQSETEFALGIYEVVKPGLIAAYEAYAVGADPIADAPSLQHIAHILIDEREQIRNAGPVLAALSADEIAKAQPWVEYLRNYLTAIGGFLGENASGAIPTDHPAAGRPAYEVPRVAARDPRYGPARVESPLRRPRNLRERQVWYAIDHANEIWAAEVPGAMMWQFEKMPWQFYLDAARWGYDEMRHAEMGIRRLRAWGFEPGIDYPMVGDPYHAILEKGGDLYDVLALLYYFEREAPKFKQQVKADYDNLGDTATAQDTDYDWADEAIHLKYGFTWLTHIFGDKAKTDMEPAVRRAGEMWETWLQERWDNGEDGYGPYMERIEAKIAAAEAESVPA